LSVAEVAERAGFSVASIYLWETGKAHPGDRSKVFGTLTMPNGQRIKTMREDAFRAALAASGQRGAR
jgi:AcrR family transcriptional regulator